LLYQVEDVLLARIDKVEILASSSSVAYNRVIMMSILTSIRILFGSFIFIILV